MDKQQIRSWIRLTLAAGNALLKQWDDEQDQDWHGNIGQSLGALRAAQEELDKPPHSSNAEITARVALEAPDRAAPYVCIGCSLVYSTCPDFNAYDCPACGEKVCPARLWHRSVVRCVMVADHLCGALTAGRASGDVLCKCGLAYRLHPFCGNSKLPESMSSSQFPHYFLHVLCGGRHVKL